MDNATTPSDPNPNPVTSTEVAVAALLTVVTVLVLTAVTFALDDLHSWWLRRRIHKPTRKDP